MGSELGMNALWRDPALWWDPAPYWMVVQRIGLVTRGFDCTTDGAALPRMCIILEPLLYSSVVKYCCLCDEVLLPSTTHFSKQHGGSHGSPRTWWETLVEVCFVCAALCCWRVPFYGSIATILLQKQMRRVVSCGDFVYKD